jgi:hypothetical protein
MRIRKHTQKSAKRLGNVIERIAIFNFIVHIQLWEHVKHLADVKKIWWRHAVGECES